MEHEHSISPLKQKKFAVHGMHCTSCEMLIAQEIAAVAGVVEVTADQKYGSVAVSYNPKHEPSQKEIAAVLKPLGYSLVNQNASLSITAKPAAPWWQVVLIVLGLYIFYRLLRWTGALDWLAINTDNMSAGLAFLVGIVASLSTCLAIVGAVVISFATKYQTNSTNGYSALRPHLFFHASRLITFAGLGAVLGLVGEWFSPSSRLIGVFTLFVGLVLLWLGGNIAGLLPSISTLGIRLPKSIMGPWQRLNSSNHPLAPWLLGGMTFFLPCGFTQSMQLYAIATGNPVTAAVTLFLFALGTVPVLLILGVTTTRFTHQPDSLFKKVIGVVVAIFALSTLASGMSVLGWSIVPSGNGVQSTVNNNEQVIKMAITPSGYQPNVFTLKRGVPVRWEIDATRMSGCTNWLMVSSLNIQQQMQRGINVINFTPQQNGTVGFSCGMGMVRGKFIVTDDATGAGDQSF